MDTLRLHAAILALLENGPLSGLEVRNRLADMGLGIEAVAFYRQTAAMEDAGLLIGWWLNLPAEGGPYKQRWLRLPPKEVK